MKNLYFSTVLFMCLFAPLLSVFAQDITPKGEAFKFVFQEGARGDGTLTLNISNTKLEITGSNSEEVIIEAIGYKKPPKRAEGLRPLYNTAVDNTGVGLQFQKEGADVEISKATREDVKYKISVPSKSNIRINETNWMGEDFHVKSVQGSIEIEAKSSDMKLEDVTGPLVLSSTNGDITVTFDQVSKGAPTSITAVNGFIDATMPSGTKANMKLRSTNGEVYTNFDIVLKKEENKPSYSHGRTIEGTVNGGGVEISFKAINDDIYLRSE